jgi:hypothetical protein
MDADTKAFSPRPGSKVSLAVQALLDGPMNTEALAGVMDSPSNSVRGMLSIPVERGLLVKVQDSTGMLHYALTGMSIDEQFVPYKGRAPGEAKLPLSPVLYPQAKTNVNPADPFGLLARSKAPADVGVRPAAALSVVKDEARSEIQEEKMPAPREPVIPPAAAPAPAAAPITLAPAAGSFEAAAFLSGDLVITVDGVSVRLTPAHQLQLDGFLANWRRPASAVTPAAPARASRGRPRRICGGCGARLSEVRFAGASTICNECREKA